MNPQDVIDSVEVEHDEKGGATVIISNGMVRIYLSSLAKMYILGTLKSIGQDADAGVDLLNHIDTELRGDSDG